MKLLQEKMIQTLPNLNLGVLLAISGFLILAFLLLSIALTLHDQKQKIRKWSHLILRWFLAIGLTCFVLLFTINLNLWTTAKQHGCDKPYAYTLQELQAGIQYSPIEDKLPEDLTNTLIIYYRFRCHDCEQIYQELTRKVNGIANVYWVASRSKSGKDLRETYPITSTPTGVYVKSDKTAVTLTLFQSENDQTYLDEEHLSALLDLLKQKA